MRNPILQNLQKQAEIERGDHCIMETTELTKEEKLQFDRELFKRSVVYNVKTLYRKELEEATPQQLFQAVSRDLSDC